MAVGQGHLVGNLSYVALGRELTYGTYNTATSGLNVMSESLKVTKETKILEEMQTSRTNSNFIQLGRSIEGEMEFIFSPKSEACNYLLHNAFGGGAVVSATATGETAGGLAFSHTVSVNNFLTTYSSLCVNIRKGDATGGKIFQYSGLRVDSLSLTAEIDEPLMASASLVGKDFTATGSDVSGAITTLTQTPLSFVNGRFSVETAVASLTTTSYWHVQNVEFSISNNLSGDSSSRRIGTDTLDVLPAGLASFELKVSMRFDTTTAIDAMMAGTRLAGQFVFEGPTLTGSAIRESVQLTFPYLIVMDAGDPEIGGPNEILASEVTFAVLRDPTSSGYAVQARVINLASTYA